MDWIKPLTEHVESNNIVIFRFSDDEWGRLAYAPRSLDCIKPFTVARSHSLLDGFSVPTVGLLFGEGPIGTEAFLSLVDSKQAISTLESRVKVINIAPVSIETEHDLLQLVAKRGLKTRFRSRLSSKESVVSVGSGLSVHLIERLADNEDNHWAMQRIVAALNSPKTYSNNAALQQDAVNLALKAFGIPPTEPADYVETTGNGETALASVELAENGFVKIYEDAVIEDDARHVPGFTFIGSDKTGLARYSNGRDTLEIITANRRDLERAFGIDLIYLNAVKQSVVMVQYKMLEPHGKGKATDWIYRPDKQFEREVERMKRFNLQHAPGQLEYRINPQVFYLRFVRRDAQLSNVTATLPIDHFEVLRDSPECKGPRGGFRITHDTLDGRYLRQEAFLDLLRSGYIGAHAQTTAHLETLIRKILNGNRALVAALHSTRTSRS